MKDFIVVGIMALFASCPAIAQSSSSTPNPPEPISPRMLVDPASTKVSLGKASLSVDPLTHKGKFYVGNYELNVVPYFFKSEKGTLELEAPDDTVDKLLGGIPVKFTGKATNKKDGEHKVITGEATPSANDHGSVTFSVETENGQMVFKTSYRFEQKQALETPAR